jgi:hypothetical protein
MKTIGSLMALVLAALAANAATNDGCTARLEIRDGSLLVGRPVGANLALRTSFAEVKLAVTLIQEVDLAGGVTNAVVRLRNGDLLRGALVEPSLRLETLVGPITVGFDLLKRARFQPGGFAANRIAVRCFMDGRTELHCQGQQLWFVHRSWKRPGDGDESQEPTFVNDQEWRPTWRGNTSNKHELPGAGLPASGQPVLKVEEVKARGVVEVTQPPREENAYTGVIVLDDASVPGQAWFEFVIVCEP